MQIKGHKSTFPRRGALSFSFFSLVNERTVEMHERVIFVILKIALSFPFPFFNFFKKYKKQGPSFLNK